MEPRKGGSDLDLAWRGEVYILILGVPGWRSIFLGVQCTVQGAPKKSSPRDHVMIMAAAIHWVSRQIVISKTFLFECKPIPANVTAAPQICSNVAKVPFRCSKSAM